MAARKQLVKFSNFGTFKFLFTNKMKVSINDGQITKTVSYVQCQSLGNC